MIIGDSSKIAGNSNILERKTSSTVELNENISIKFAKKSGIEEQLIETKDDKKCDQEDKEEDNQIILEEVFVPGYKVSEEEVVEYVERLGLDSNSDPHLLALARQALLTPLPSSWTPVKDKQYGIYYFNNRTGESSWTHPVDASLKDFLSKAMGCKQDKAATDTDSCVEDLKTEEADSYRKKGSQLTSNIDSGTSLSNASLSSKSSPRKGPNIATKLDKFDDCKDKIKTNRPEGDDSPIEFVADDSKTAEVKLDISNVSMAGRNPSTSLPALGKGQSSPLPSIAKGLSKPNVLPGGGRLTALTRQTTAVTLDSFTGSPSHSQPPQWNAKKISLSMASPADPPSKIASSSGIFSSPSRVNKNESHLKLSGDRLRDSSPEKRRVRFLNDSDDAIDEFHSTDEESSSECRRNIQKALTASQKSYDTNSATVTNLGVKRTDPLEFGTAYKDDPWTDENPILKKQRPVSPLTKFTQEENNKKEISQGLAKDILAKGGRSTLQPIGITKQSSIVTNRISTTKISETMTTAVASSVNTSISKAPLSATVTSTIQSRPSLAATKQNLDNKNTTQVNSGSTGEIKTPTTAKPTPGPRPTTTAVTAAQPTPGPKTASSTIPVVQSTSGQKPAGVQKVIPKTTTASDSAKVSTGQKTSVQTNSTSTPVSKGLSVTTSNVNIGNKVTPTPQAQTAVKTAQSVAITKTTLTTNSSQKTNASATKVASSVKTDTAPVNKTITGKPSIPSEISETPSKKIPQNAVNSSDLIPPSEREKLSTQADSHQLQSTLKPTTIKSQSAHDLELEESGDRPKRTTNPMGKLLSKFANKTEGMARDDSLKQEFQDKLESDNHYDEPTPCKSCSCSRKREEIALEYLRGLTRSASDEDFLRRTREEQLRQEELEAELKRKRELARTSATLDIERSMGVLLKERQLELKREHIKSLSLLKEDIESNINEVKREAEQKELMERQHQRSRLNYVQDQNNHELEALQSSHQRSLEAMKLQNQKELEQMKCELRQYMVLHKEEFESTLKETCLDKEMHELLTPTVRPRVRSNSGNQSKSPPSFSYGVNDMESGAPPGYPRDATVSSKGNYDEVFLLELNNLRREIADIKNMNIKPVSAEIPFQERIPEHGCKYGSKYKDIRKRYSSLRKRIKDEKLKQRTQKGTESGSSTSSESSPAKVTKAKKSVEEITSNDSSTESSADILAEWNHLSNNITPGATDYPLLSSTPKKSSVKKLKLRSPIPPMQEDFGGTDWLTMEGNRILAQTEQFLSSIKYSDSELEFNLQKPEDDSGKVIFEGENLDFPISYTDDFVPPDSGHSPIFSPVNHYENHSLENLSDVYSSTKSELDLILENVVRKSTANPKTKRNYLTWKEDEEDFVPHLIRNQPHPTYQRPPQSDVHADDMFAINNYLKNKWKSYFGDLSSPLTGRAGWPSRHSFQSQIILPTSLPNHSVDHSSVFNDTENISKQIENIRTWLNETQELTESIAE